MGCGVVIGRQESEYLVATACHVIEDDAHYELLFADGRQEKGKAIWRDRQCDSGLLTFQSSQSYQVASLAASNAVPGEKIFKIGWANGKFNQTVGTVTRADDFNFLAMVWSWHGDSGGGYFNSRGELLGILSGSPSEGSPYSNGPSVTRVKSQVERCCWPRRRPQPVPPGGVVVEAPGVRVDVPPAPLPPSPGPSGPAGPAGPQGPPGRDADPAVLAKILARLEAQEAALRSIQAQLNQKPISPQPAPATITVIEPAKR